MEYFGTIKSKKLSDLAATTSAELYNVITDKTGTNLLVFNTNPWLTGIKNVGYALLQKSISVNSGAAYTIQYSSGYHQKITLTDDTTLTLGTLPLSTDETDLLIEIIQDASNYTVEWSNITWASGFPPNINDGAATKTFIFIRGDSTGWVGFTANPGYRPINAQTGTTYTLVLADAGKMVTCSNASAVTLTVPLNSSVAFPVGVEIDLVQTGVGKLTVAAAGGVTINSINSVYGMAGQYAGATLKKIATDTWLLVGALVA